MYEAHFGLTERPFSIAPDPRYLYMSTRHREALAHLLYAVNQSGGFVQLSGEVGTGKTTICRCFLEQLPEQVDVALIVNPRVTEQELLATVCDELHIAYPPRISSLKVLVDRLNEHLLESHGRGRRTLLVIDEAQNLSTEVLEMVRLLTNLETGTQKLLQIILIGQPELMEKLQRPELRQLAQRVTARYHLRPLSRGETHEYIDHRLAVVGCHRRLFSNGALWVIYKRSGGIPRLINILCDRALLGAYSHSKQRVDAFIARQAGEEIGKPGVRPARRRPLVWSAAAAVLVGIAAGGWGLYTPGARQWLAQLGSAPAQLPASTAIATPLGLERETLPAALAPVRAEISSLRPQALAQRDPETAPGPGRPTLASPPEEETADVAASPLTLIALLERAAPLSREDAFARLVSYWPDAIKPSHDRTVCKEILSEDLGCLTGRGNWNSLRRYDRPALLELIGPRGKVYYLVVFALQDDTVHVDIAGDQHAVSRDEVEPLWYGRFEILWRRPPLRRTLIAPGSRGADVLWLRRAMARLGGEEPKPGAGNESFFDETLARQIGEFQSSRAIRRDGVVGVETLIHLNTLLGARVPRLSPET